MYRTETKSLYRHISFGSLMKNGDNVAAHTQCTLSHRRALSRILYVLPAHLLPVRGVAEAGAGAWGMPLDVFFYLYRGVGMGKSRKV